jgi:hypothetical protein
MAEIDATEIILTKMREIKKGFKQLAEELNLEEQEFANIVYRKYLCTKTTEEKIAAHLGLGNLLQEKLSKTSNNNSDWKEKYIPIVFDKLFLAVIVAIAISYFNYNCFLQEARVKEMITVSSKSVEELDKCHERLFTLSENYISNLTKLENIWNRIPENEKNAKLSELWNSNIAIKALIIRQEALFSDSKKVFIAADLVESMERIYDLISSTESDTIPQSEFSIAVNQMKAKFRAYSCYIQNAKKYCIENHFDKIQEDIHWRFY